MITIGKNIRSASDMLERIDISELYDRIWMPGSDLQSKVAQLRKVRQLDTARYKEMKKELPYVVCAVFNPPYRRIENFAYTEYFMIDIDNLSEKQIDPETLKNELKADTRVMMSFISPSEDGLKVLFRLKEKCYDSGLYSMFYKVFARKFSEQHDLTQVVDTRTCDVSRACFLSWDANAYYNADAEPVDLKLYADVSDPTLLFDEYRKTEKAELEREPADKEPKNVEPDDEAMEKIKSLLNPKYTAEIKKKDVYVPEILQQVAQGMKAFMDEMGLEVYEVIDINYGKKFRIRMGNKMAELNVFYGKRGFSVVESPRNGTDEQLNDISAQAAIMYINTRL